MLQQRATCCQRRNARSCARRPNADPTGHADPHARPPQAASPRHAALRATPPPSRGPNLLSMTTHLQILALQVSVGALALAPAEGRDRCHSEHSGCVSRRDTYTWLQGTPSKGRCPGLPQRRLAAATVQVPAPPRLASGCQCSGHTQHTAREQHASMWRRGSTRATAAARQRQSSLRAGSAGAAAGCSCSSSAQARGASKARPGAHLNLSVSCEGWSLAERALDATNMRMPPCSSPPRAGAHVGLCAVVMAAAARPRRRSRRCCCRWRPARRLALSGC